MPETDAATLLQEIADERGGAANMSAVQLAACRQLARLLALGDGDPSALAKGIAAFETLLPPKISEPPLDLARLTDSQLGQLEFLVSVARGIKPPPRLRQHRYSARRHYACKLAQMMDIAEKRDGRLTDKEKVEVRSLLHAVLGALIPIPQRLWQVDEPPPRTSSPQAEEVAKPAPEPSLSPPLTVASDNIVTFDPSLVKGKTHGFI